MFFKTKSLILLVSISLFILTGCQKVFFQPKETLIYSASVTKYNPKNLIVKISDNREIHGWFFKTLHKSPKGTIIFFHGNSNNISYESRKVLFVLEEGYNLLTFDYGGYGYSEGSPTVDSVLNDSLEFIDKVIDEEITKKSLGITNLDNLIIHGQSMGGATVSHVARYCKHKDKFKTLILDSTFTSWQQIVREVSRKHLLFWPWEDLTAIIFPDSKAALDNIEHINIENILIMHSKADRLIDFHHSEEIFEKANSKNVIFLSDKSSKHARMFENKYIRKAYIDFINESLNYKN